MNKKQLFFLAGAIFIYVFIIRLIPIYMLVSGEFVWATAAAIGAGVCLYQALKPDEKKMYTPENYDAAKSRTTFAIVIAVVAAFATVISVLFTTGSREAAYIKKNSVIAEGTIIDGKAETTKRKGSTSTSYTLDVSFDVNGKSYTKSVDVDGSDWGIAGKGMPVLVSYAKEHPGLCKILFNAEQVKKYTTSDQIKPLDLETLSGLVNKTGKEIMQVLSKSSMGWNKQESESGTDFCYHSVYKTSVINNEETVYLAEIEKGGSFNLLLDEARKKMQVVYDSMQTNPKKGILFKKDSLQIRFQRYQKMITEDNNEFNIPVMKHITTYAAGITTSPGSILLPGDLVPDLNDPVSRDALRKKAAREALDKLRNQ